MVFTADVYGGGAWSGSTDHLEMVRAERAALSASCPALVVEVSTRQSRVSAVRSCSSSTPTSVKWVQLLRQRAR